MDYADFTDFNSFNLPKFKKIRAIREIHLIRVPDVYVLINLLNSRLLLPKLINSPISSLYTLR